MREADLQTTVIDMCGLLHLRVAHFRPCKQGERWVTAVAGDGAGFPDLVIVGPGGVLFRELKTDGASLSKAQQTWRDALDLAEADWGIWRPDDLTSGRILTELKSLSNRET